MQDRALALPPLNSFIIKKLIQQTKVVTLLREFLGMPAVNIESVENILLLVSEMVCELPYIKELDINPLIVNENEATDARTIIDYPLKNYIPYGHLAIHPYPRHLISE